MDEKEINKLLSSLENEIKETQSGVEQAEALERLKEIACTYDGDDKIISFQEIEVNLKDAPPVVKISSGVKGLDDLLYGGFMEETVTTVSATPKSGKCLSKGTEVLMFDGSLKKVEDIVIGDKLMGFDSKERNVLALGNGKEEMFKISQRGAEYTVNKSHILSLKKTGCRNFSRGKKINNKKGKILNVSVQDYLQKSNNFKHHYKGYKTGVEFNEQHINFDPYILGLWLGDGTSSKSQITSADKEIAKYIKEFANLEGLNLKIHRLPNNKASTYSLSNSWNNHLLNDMKEYDLINNKHIPKQYKINSREIRLEVLAGLIDSDGHLTRNKYPYIDYITKSKKLSDDIYFLASSLGFQVVVTSCKKGIKSRGFIGNYFRISISGDLSQIPTRIKRKQSNFKNQKEVLTSSIKVESLGIGKYYGFELDGDGLFVLGNFVVTHNTSFLMYLTSKMEHFNPLWLALEESPKSLIRKMIKNNVKVPNGFAPKTNPYVTLQWVESKIVESIAKNNTKVVFIDQLDFIVPQDGSDGRHDLKIAQTMRILHQIAVKWKIAIFLICHLEKIEPDTKPTVKNLRGSSSIWGEADNCIFLWRECFREKGQLEFTNNVEVSLQANREDGGSGVIHMVYRDGRFHEEDWKPTESKALANW